MKKSLVSALTTALVVGAASTTFAAANPFSDVAPSHWAYDAVIDLSEKGVIVGYGDGTFRGERNITRYEAAQMVAKAMAQGTAKTASDQAILEKLKAEFAPELENLGVRVAELEKHADMVQWTGKIEYTYTSERLKRHSARAKKNNDGYIFRLEPKAEVNDHWTVNARLDAEGNMKEDSSTDVKAKRVWAQGDYRNFQIKLGKMEFYTNEKGLLWDTEYSGAQMTFGNKLKATLMAGRINNDSMNVTNGDAVITGRGGAYETLAGINSLGVLDPRTRFDDTTSMQGINIQYDVEEKGLYGGAGYYHLSNEAFRAINDTFRNDGKNAGNKANIWSVNAGYKFGRKANLWGSYAKNQKAEYEDNAWQVEFDYGTYDDRADKGAWKAYVAYRKMGTGVSFAGTYDGVMQGTKGVEVGAAYAPFKNVGLLVKYFKGDTISGDFDAEKLFGRVEFFF